MDLIYNNKTNYKIDITKPPMGHPIITKKLTIFQNLIETKESKKQRKDYDVYIDKYMKELKEYRHREY